MMTLLSEFRVARRRTNDEGRTTKDERQRITGHTGRWSLVVGRWSLILGLFALLALAGCGLAPESTTTPSWTLALVLNAIVGFCYFSATTTINTLVQQLADDDKRGQWVERLASHFAPNERDDQRIALRSSLDSFVAGLGKLEPNESMTIELRFDGVEKVSQSDSRATVRPVNGSIYILITRTTGAGVATLYEDTVALDKIIGSPDGTVPAIRVGRTWYLTEG